jgi:hypothetical protein
MLRSGTTRDVLAVRKNRTFHCYGAKIISWLEPPDDTALNSRCILIPMFESKSTTLVRADEPNVQRMAADLQAQLLRFRLENYKIVSLPPFSATRSFGPVLEISCEFFQQVIRRMLNGAKVCSNSSNLARLFRWNPLVQSITRFCVRFFQPYTLTTTSLASGLAT